MKLVLTLILLTGFSLASLAATPPATIKTSAPEIFYDPVSGQYINIYGEMARQIYNQLSYEEAKVGTTMVKANSLTLGKVRIWCEHRTDTNIYLCQFNDVAF